MALFNFGHNDLKSLFCEAKKNAGFIKKHLLLIFCLSVICSASLAFGNETEKYMDGLKSADINARIKAATELAKSHYIEGVKLALKDPDKKVRQAAISNLSILSPGRGEQKDPEAVTIIIQTLKDVDPDVRYAALYKLRDYQIDASFGRYDTDPDICREMAGLFRDPSEHIRNLKGQVFYFDIPPFL